MPVAEEDVFDSGHGHTFAEHAAFYADSRSTLFAVQQGLKYFYRILDKIKRRVGCIVIHDFTIFGTGLI